MLTTHACQVTRSTCADVSINGNGKNTYSLTSYRPFTMLSKRDIACSTVRVTMETKRKRAKVSDVL